MSNVESNLEPVEITSQEILQPAPAEETPAAETIVETAVAAVVEAPAPVETPAESALRLAHRAPTADRGF